MKRNFDLHRLLYGVGILMAVAFSVAAGAIFLSASRETVEVELTDDGLTYLYSRSVLRPAKIERLPYPNHHRIRFKATKLHTFMYFFKFGKDAVIISPKSYRNFFITNYKEAVQKYESLDN